MNILVGADTVIYKISSRPNAYLKLFEKTAIFNKSPFSGKIYIMADIDGAEPTWMLTGKLHLSY